MIMNVNATRMELQKLKKRVKIARRGHKLLKDKQDELMRQMLSQIEEVKAKRIEIEREFQSILQSFVLAQSELGKEQMEESLSLPTKEVSILVETKSLMSVKIPEFKKEVSGDIICYGFLNTSGEMDFALLKFEKFLDREVNKGFSGGELKKSELLQLLIQDPDLVLLDEPESGVDVENIQLIGNMIKRLLQKDIPHKPRNKSGLIITHTGFILHYVAADLGYVIMDGEIYCQGNPVEIFEGIQKYGYEECKKCLKRIKLL